jgi:hypothetical protein
MRKINPPAPKFRRLIFTGFLFLIGTGLFSQTIRQNETASFNEIKTGLDQRKIEYTERELLADYGVFGKSIFTGNAASETNPFLFVFPVSDCYQDLAFSLAEHTATEATNTPVIFLADAWSPASLDDLLETLDSPQNAVLMYFALDMPTKNTSIESTPIENTSPEKTSTENTATEPIAGGTTNETLSTENKTSSFIVTFFQGTIKNPFHLTGTFAKYLEDRNIPFSFRDKNIILAANTFSDMNEAASVLLPFAAASPPPETDPDIYYIAADFSSRKIILDNVAILKIVLIASAVLLFINLFFAVIFNKKRILVIMLSVFFIFAGIFLLNNPLYSPKDIALNPAEPQNIRSTEGISGVKVTRTVFLDRITYTIKAAYDTDPTRITIFYDMENAAMPAEVYESPFPSEITESRITFILGEYPPNPFETEIAFPHAYPGILTVIATSEQGAAVWTEQEP